MIKNKQIWRFLSENKMQIRMEESSAGTWTCYPTYKEEKASYKLLIDPNKLHSQNYTPQNDPSEAFNNMCRVWSGRVMHFVTDNYSVEFPIIIEVES